MGEWNDKRLTPNFRTETLFFSFQDAPRLSLRAGGSGRATMASHEPMHPTEYMPPDSGLAKCNTPKPLGKNSAAEAQRIVRRWLVYDATTWAPNGA
ncbi:uncharacterized protein PG998_003294 [Apiospora kogelbergensis]|uniref:Uncharacterized protein n=1 Tax=Apiospora kogelbergensis TaxID=1337665 RepID=A0AAW0QQ57_9PEZI